MSLANFLQKHLLQLQSPAKDEIEKLFQIVDRDLKDVKTVRLSSDRTFAIAYNAALILTMIVLRAKGYRTNPSMGGHHAVCIKSLPFLMGNEWKSFARYLDACRGKRHVCEYISVDEVEAEDAETLAKEAEKFRIEVLKWLKTHHPDLVPD